MHGNVHSNRPMRRFLTRLPEGRGQLLAPPPALMLQIWLDSRKGLTISSGTITRWADQSGNGRDVIPALGGGAPIYSPAATPQGRDAILMRNSPYLGLENTGLPIYDVTQGLSQYWLGRVKGIPDATCTGAWFWPVGNGTQLVLHNQTGVCSNFVPSNNDGYETDGYAPGIRITAPNEWVQYALVISAASAATVWQNGVKVASGTLIGLTASNHLVMSTNSIAGPPNIQFQAASYLMYNQGHSDAIAAQIAQWQTVTYGIGVN